MPLLQIENLTHFFGGLRAVSNFEAQIEKGEIVGLIGPNGAGKTTIFNLICGLYRPTEGKITLNGANIAGLPAHEVASTGVGRTFQNLRLFRNLTVLHNIKIAQYSQINYSLADAFLRTKHYQEEEKKAEERAYQLLDTLSISHYANQLALNLPYGDQRRVEMARAMALKPKLLLLDEPTAGMSPAEMMRMAELIEEIKEKFDLTIFLIEHRMRVVMGICERIVAIDFGALIGQGTPDQIRNDPKVKKAYLGEEVVM
ncbi:MAG: ABC transporter ATP-binding protein [Anaerolineae bacterium]|nr:ABC transporter ATP-binding protein [Anaerolineae bacterium]